MTNIVLGVFDDRTHAENAINKLGSSGFNSKDISIVMKDSVEGQRMADSTGANVAEGAVSGAATGGVIGGIAGLLMGIGAITIPGLGPLLIGGPIAAALGLTGAAATTVTGAATGAVAGGLLGALMGLGLPKEKAEVYQQRIEQGAILLAVPTRDNGDTAKGILETNGASDVTTLPVEGSPAASRWKFNS